MNELNLLAPLVPATDNVLALDSSEAITTTEPVPHLVDPARSAAGRLGGKRVHQLADLGRVYEQEHGLKAGRQRLKQLVQLGRRYEVETGVRPATPKRRQRAGDSWQEFLAALARVVKPAHRPAVAQLAAALRPGPQGIETGLTEHAA